MPDKTNLNNLGIKERVLSNLPRAGLLAIPGIGPAIEKAIFGPLDEKERDEARRQIHDALNELRGDVRFAQADLKDDLLMLAEKISAVNVELAESIKRLDPIHIENFILQNIRQTVINVFVKINPEEVRSLIDIAGMMPGEIPAKEIPELVGEVLFDAAAQQGNLPQFVGALAENHPPLLEQFDDEPSISTVKNLKAKLANASLSLLKWPTTLGDGVWLHRGELDDLEERLRSAEGTANLILGKPGTGKSAVLALLGQRLIDKGIPVLAIKADMLPRWIKSLGDLQTHLHLPFPVLKCLGIVSRSEPAVLIVDQLDAISEFVDRNSERLNLLLDLIHVSSMIDGLHIVSSCRWFEYQHDIRLTTIEAERISLDPPSWDDVKEVLKEAGFPEEHWTDEVRNLLSVPLHLKILLDLKSRDQDFMVPSSLQGLLENIWQQRVISGESGSDKLNFIDILCKRMSEEEELWVPITLADDYSHIFEELQQGNILQMDSLGLKIGFVHQIYFDFARARSFARGQEMLSEYVIQRQDGLFIRPVLLSSLDYLRGASPSAYESEVRSLWNKEGLRPHMRNLLVEYLGSVERPNETEISCLLPMLEEREKGYKAFSAMAGSPGWFYIIKDHYLPTLMSQGPEFAHFSMPILSSAFFFAKDDVAEIVKNAWLPDNCYDESILRLFTYLSDWDENSVEIICEVAKRHESFWVPHIADLVSQSKPDLAPKIVRVDFERRLHEAKRKEAEAVPPTPPPPEASDKEKLIYQLQRRKGEEIQRLLGQDKGWHDLSQIAVTVPKAFLDRLWPWFTSVVELIAYDPHPFVTTYREDHSIGKLNGRSGGTQDQPVSALRDAIEALGEKFPDLFLTFFNNNIDSPYMTVHCLLCFGLLKLAKSHPDVILDYLTSDPRRLVVGDSYDCHKMSRGLITSIVPYLDEKGRLKLENAVVSWNRYYKEDPSWEAEDKFRRKKWNREHRLRLLREFPEEYLSEQTRQLRDQEERALPNVADYDARIEVGSWVGSPMSHEQMAKAKDEHILNFFEELDDSTEWDHPRRNWDFIGGSVQASREFGKLAEQDPEKVEKLIPNFEPGKQERPAAMAVEGLEKSSFPSEKLFNLIDELVQKGHSSFNFRREIARALDNRANKNKGLPDGMIDLLEEWLSEDPSPSKEERSDRQDKNERDQSVLWGYGFSYSLPGGRDVYMDAIANGYLLRDPPEYEGFSKVVESRLKLEIHPEIWKLALRRISFLFNWNSRKASSYFDNILKNFKEVRESKHGVLEIGRVLHLVPELNTLKKLLALLYDYTIGLALDQAPKHNTIKKWLILLRDSTNDFAQQAFGELVMLLIFRKSQGKWAKKQIEASLNKKQAKSIHRGLAFAASYNWRSSPYQDLCTEVIVRLSSSDDDIVQKAISQVFIHGEKVTLNDNMKKVIEAILPYDQVLLKSADRLIEGVMDQTATEPEIIGPICIRVLEAGKTEIQNVGSRLAFTAEAIVSIALTLHRKPPPYRDIGLEIFERLIDSNISQARQALDILDRKPVTTHAPRPMRKRRRRRR